MKIIGIMGAMDIEVQLIKSKMEGLEESIKAGFKFVKGRYKNIEVVIVTCGVGKVNAASCTQILIDRFEVDGIINTGIAGSLNEKVKLCDIVISDNVTYYDVRQAQMKSCFPFKEFFTPCSNLKEVAIDAYEKCVESEYSYHIGRIVTGEAFVSDDELRNSIIKNYEPYCCEMEGGAIGHVAEINQVPFIIIRSISDNANGDSEMTYEKFEAIAANNSAKLVLNMLEILNEKA